MSQIFKNCKDQIDYQEYLIFIYMLIELYEKTNVQILFSNYLMKLFNNIHPDEESDETINDKLLLLESCNYFLSLKLLYAKFSKESKKW